MAPVCKKARSVKGKMKDNYNKGFLTGVLVTLGIVLGAVLVYFVFFHDLLKNNSGNDQSGLGVDSYDTFIEKENTIIDIVKEKYYEDVDDQTLYDGAYNGIISSIGDPYASYYSGRDYATISEAYSGEYVGIGVYVFEEKETHEVQVVSVIKGGPAERAGVLAGDIIVEIDGRDITGMDLDQAVSFVKGKVGSKVVITVKREGEKIEFSMNREKIEPQQLAYQMIDGNVGYIYVASFYNHIPDQFKAAIADMESQGMEKLIVDLRDNPGGLYDVAVKMVDIFIDRDLVVAYTEDSKGKQEMSYTNDTDTFDKPTVILINGNTASASELFTQTLREYGKATVIGTRSYGKGVFQGLYSAGNDGSVVKVTSGRYYSPNGVCIDKVGIEPDITVEYVAPDMTRTDLELKDDNQIKAALDYLAKGD